MAMLVIGAIKEQLIQLLSLAWVTAATQLLLTLPILITIPVAGHIDQDSLDAVGMGYAIFCFNLGAVLTGLATASETLLSQINGSSNKFMLGVVAQRGLVIKVLASVLVSSVLIHTESLLILCGQERKLAWMTHQFILSVLPGEGIGLAVLLTQLKYLQTQKIVKPCLLSGLLANILHIGYIAGLVFGLKLGIIGCGLSVSLTILSWNVILLSYIIVSKVYKETWSGFSLECLTDWSTFLKYGVSGIAMFVVEMSCYNIVTILAGLLEPLQLSIHLIVNTVSAFCYHMAIGVGSAATVQIGNYLGGGDPMQARTAAMVSMCVAMCYACMVSLGIFATHNYIPYIFTDNQDIISAAQSTLLILCAQQAVNVVMMIQDGILRAQGKQLFGAMSNIVCLGMVSMPFAVVLMFCTPLKVAGAWIALTCGCIVQVTAYSLKIYFTDWDLEAERAQKNAGQTKEVTERIKNKEQITIDQNENTFLTNENKHSVSRSTIILRSVQISTCICICIVSCIVAFLK